MADEDVLIHADDQGSWGWAGSLLVPGPMPGRGHGRDPGSAPGPDSVPGPGQGGGSGLVNHYTGFDRYRREQRTADAETAWLAAQWGANWSPEWGPGGAGRFEIRYRNDPAAGDGLVRCAILCRVRGESARHAVNQARAYRSGLAFGLPAHVRAEPLIRAADVHGWLVPFDSPGLENSQTEIIKRLSWKSAMRPDADRTITLLVARLSGRRVSWEPMLRQLAALPFPAVLSIGFEPFERSVAFRLKLQDLAEHYAVLAKPFARPYAGSGPRPKAPIPPDHFAARAAQRYAQLAQEYDTPAFRVRISLAGTQELPDQLATWLSAALGDTGPEHGGPEIAGLESIGPEIVGPESGGAAASALRPLPHERDVAWANMTTLSAAWLTDTFRGRLPEVVLGPLERDLMTLVDLAEARSLIQLPISWPDSPDLFAGIE